MVDTSYFGIIELHGARQELIRVLQRIASGAFAGAKYESGAKVARVDVYRVDAYPLSLIGPAEIIWQGAEMTQAGKDERTVWVRLHPAMFDQVWQELKIASAQPVAGGSSSSHNVAAPLHIRDLRGEVDSFELTGPTAGRVLRRVLRVCHDEDPEKRGFFEALGHMQSAGALPEGLVAGFKVYDPRLQCVPVKSGVHCLVRAHLGWDLD